MSTNPWRALLAAAVIVPALPAHAGGTNYVSATTPETELWEASSVNTPIWRGALPPITLGDGPGTVYHAAASGQTLTLRSAVAGQHSEHLNETVTARSQWNVVVGGGSTGLAIGTPMTVNFSFRLDGGLAAGMAGAFVPFWGGLGPDYQFEARASAMLNVEAIDLDSPSYEPGAADAEFWLGAGAAVSSYWHEGTSEIDPEVEFTRWSHDVNGSGRDNRGFWDINGDSDLREIADATVAKEVYDFDSGIITLSFDSFVGNRLVLDFSLVTNLFCNSYSPNGHNPVCAGQADFAHTFDGELSSNIPGIEFIGVTPGVMPAIPEPATTLLWLAGGLALAGRRRLNIARCPRSPLP